MTTVFKVNLDLQANAILPEEPVWEGRWVNLWYRTNGETQPSRQTYASKEEAALNAGITPPNATKIKWRNGHIPRDELSHSIPMPIREGGE